MATQLNPDLKTVLRQFLVEGAYLDACPYGCGHINDTYLARFGGPVGGVRRYIVQRINRSVFIKPAEVMHNMDRVTAHIRQVVAAAGDLTPKTITLVPTLTGHTFYLSPTGDTWRVSCFIEGTRTYQRAVNPEHNYYAARAFGEFLVYLSGFPIEDLFVTIPDFHNTPKRYQAFLEALGQDRMNRAQSVRNEIEFVIRRESQTSILADLMAAGEIPERVTHNDTKIDNVMIDEDTGVGQCVIDLDTVMPGLAVFDFGDSVRSGSNTAVEDEPCIKNVRFDLDIFDRLAHGFLDATRDILTPVEINHLVFGARLITLEQGIRFLTDYLSGDTYYKISRPTQNLDRTRTQLKLVAEMEAKDSQMGKIIEKYR